MGDNLENAVVVTESGNGRYGQFVTAGRHVMGADEPEKNGGRDSGPSPYEYLLAGLGACTAMTVRMYAERHNWPLEKVSVALKHDRVQAQEGAGQLDRFERAVTLSGPLTDEQKMRLVEIAERCPVSRTLRQASTIVTLLS